MKTKTAAIRHARQKVSFVQTSRDSYTVSTYDPSVRAWRQGYPSQYWAARAAYSQALVDCARQFLELRLVQYEGGPWTSYV